MSKQFLDLDNVHACIEQTGGASMAQTMWEEMVNPNSNTDLGDILAQSIGGERSAVLLKPDEIALLPLAALQIKLDGLAGAIREID
jgi:hypothetical protein